MVFVLYLVYLKGSFFTKVTIMGVLKSIFIIEILRFLNFIRNNCEVLADKTANNFSLKYLIWKFETQF